jgi:histidyl-tRNA synthetase
MFRYERPQKGRTRQFNQAGVEIFGVPGPAADAEIIALLSYFLERVGFPAVSTRINSVGCPTCRKEYNSTLRAFLKEHEKDLCGDCSKRSKKNPLRVFDCKNKDCKKTIKDAPLIGKSICEECASHFKELCTLLDGLKVKYEVDDHLVRGFDYYTKTVFETVLEGLGAQDAVLGGGRYDNLVEDLGGDPTPGVGASFGIERLVIAMKENDIPLPSQYISATDAYLIALDDKAIGICTELANMLRREGIRTKFDAKSRSFKSGLRAANKSNARFTLIVGDEEQKDKKVLVKEMESGEQRHVPLDEVVKAIR